MSIDAGPHELFTTPATVVDAPAVAELVNLAWRHSQGRGAWTSEAAIIDGERIDVDGALAAVQGAGSRVLVVRGPAGLNGCVQVAGCETGHALIDLLAVRPRLQCALMGRGLLAAAEKCARRELAATRVTISVPDCREELIGWLERRGYVLTDDRRPYVPTAGDAGVPLRELVRVTLARTLSD